MPDDKKSYKVDGQVYDIPATEAQDFLHDNPKAQEVHSFVSGKDTFDIPVNEVPDFLKEMPDAKPLGYDSQEVKQQSQPQQPQVQQPSSVANPLDEQIGEVRGFMSNADKPITPVISGTGQATGSFDETQQDIKNENQTYANAGLDNLSQQLNVPKDDLKGVIQDFGYTNSAQEIQQMTQLKQNNPVQYERAVGAHNWQSILFNSYKDKVGERAAHDIFNQEINGNANGQQNDPNKTFQSVVNQYQQNRKRIEENVTDPGEREKAVKGLDVDAAINFGGGIAGTDDFLKATPESAFLNANQNLALQYMKVTNPGSAKSFNNILLDKNTLTTFEQQLGYEEKARQLDEAGIGLRLNENSERLNAAKQSGNQEEYNSLTEQRKTLQQYKDDLPLKYPKAYALDANQLAQELVGQRHGLLAHTLLTAGRETGNTIEGTLALLKAPFTSDNDYAAQLGVLGDAKLSNYSTYRTQENQVQQSFETKVSPELKSKTDDILNNKDLSDDEKRTQIATLIRNNPGGVFAQSIDSKFNITAKGLLYSSGETLAEVAPFIVAAETTGGLGNMGRVGRALSTFAAASATGYENAYVTAVQNNEADPKAWALRSTAINSAAMVVGDKIEAIKGFFKPGSAISETINKLSDAEIIKMIEAKPNTFKDIGKALLQTTGQSLGAGARIAGATTGAQIINDALDGKMKDVGDYTKEFAIQSFSMLPLGLFGAKAQYDNIKEGGKLTAYHAATNAPEMIAAVDESIKRGSLSQEAGDGIKANIGRLGEIYNSTSFTDDNGKPLSDKAKADLLLTRFKQSKFEEASKINTSDKVKTDNEHQALVANEYANLIHANDSVEDLQKQRESLINQISEKDENGKLVLNLKEQSEIKSKIGAIDQYIKDNENKQADTKTTEPVAAKEGKPVEAIPNQESGGAKTTFKTSKGSTYEVQQDGTTIRNKSFHAEHGGDEGVKPASSKTVYVTKDDLNKLDLVQATSARDGEHFTIAHLPDGKIGVGMVTEDGKGNHGKVVPRTIVTPKSEPEVGLYPVETWEGHLQPHFGNEITEVNKATNQEVKLSEEQQFIQQNIDNGTITNEHADGFAKSTAEQQQRIEPAISDIESKAESSNETDLNEAIESADKLIAEAHTEQPAESGTDTKTQEPNSEQVGTTEPQRTTSIKNETTLSERQQRGREEVEVQARRTFGDVFDKGKEFVDSGKIDPRSLAKSLSEKPRALKPEESVALLYDRMRLQNEHAQVNGLLKNAYESGDEAAQLEASVRLSSLEDDINYNDEASRRTGYEQGLGLAIRKLMIKQDYSLANQLQQFKNANGGQEIPADVRSKLESLTTKLSEANDKLDAYEKRISDLEAQKNKNEQKPKEKTKKTKEEFSTEREQVFKNIADKWKNAGNDGTLTAVPIPYAKQLAAITPDVLKLIKSYAEQGVTELSKIIDDLHGNISPAIPEITKDDIRDILAGEYAEKKAAPTLTPEKLRIQADVEKIKDQIEVEKFKLKQKQRTTLKKGLDWFATFRRAVILSSVQTVGKLTTAASYRQLTNVLEEGVGTVINKVPGISKIAAGAPREGGSINMKAEAKSIAQWWAKDTYKDALQVVRTGKGSLDYLYGDKKQMPKSVLEYIGNLHGSLKVPAKRAEFQRAFEKRALNAQQNGEDISSPEVQTRLATESYIDAKRAIFMSDNIATDAYQKMVRSLEDSETKKGQVAATVLRVLIPIVKIPSNYVAEATSYAAGGIKALPNIFKAISKGVDALTPEEKDYVMRNLKKQGLGAAIFTLGYMNPQAVGGYYTGKRKEDDVDASGLRLFGTDMPHWMLHAPILEVLQMGGTFRRVQDEYASKKQKGGTLAATGDVGKGLLEEVPFMSATTGISEATKDEKGATSYAGNLAESFVVPPDVQRIAKAKDIDAEGNPVKRKPQAFTDYLKQGVPGLREQVPIDPIHKILESQQEKPAWKFLSDKGVDLPEQNQNTVKLNLPDGSKRKMTDDEFAKYFQYRNDILEKEINELSKKNGKWSKTDTEGNVFKSVNFNDLSPSQLKSVLKSFESKATEQAKEKLIKEKNIKK